MDTRPSRVCSTLAHDLSGDGRLSADSLNTVTGSLLSTRPWHRITTSIYAMQRDPPASRELVPDIILAELTTELELLYPYLEAPRTSAGTLVQDGSKDALRIKWRR